MYWLPFRLDLQQRLMESDLSYTVWDSTICLTDVSGLLCSLPFKLRALPVTWGIYRALFCSTDHSKWFSSPATCRSDVSIISHSHNRSHTYQEAIRNNLRSVCCPVKLWQTVTNWDWTVDPWISCQPALPLKSTAPRNGFMGLKLKTFLPSFLRHQHNITELSGSSNCRQTWNSKWLQTIDREWAETDLHALFLKLLHIGLSN